MFVDFVYFVYFLYIQYVFIFISRLSYNSEPLEIDPSANAPQHDNDQQIGEASNVGDQHARNQQARISLPERWWH